jgi:hypothetical protein
MYFSRLKSSAAEACFNKDDYIWKECAAKIRIQNLNVDHVKPN